MLKERRPKATPSRAPNGWDLLDAVPGIIWTLVLQPGERLSEATPITYVSHGAEALLGYPVADWQTVGFWYAHVHPVDRERTLGELAAAMAAGRNHDLDYRMFTADGRLIWVRGSANVRAGADGKVWAYGIVQDTTVQKEAVAERERALIELSALREQAEGQSTSLQTILDTMLEPLWVWDANSRLKLANAAALRMFRAMGVSAPEAWLGQSIDAVLREVNLWDRERRLIPAEEVPQRLARLTADNEARDVWWGRPGIGPQVFMRTLSAAIRDPQGHLLGIVTTGIELTWHEVFRKQRDRFLRVTAHELRTPLAIIKGYVQVLLQLFGLADEAQRPLRAIDRNVDRLSRVIHNLVIGLEIELRDVLPLEPVALDALVRTTIERFPLPSERHQFDLTVAEPITIMGSRELLAQVLVALLDNAVRFSPHGGAITVALVKCHGEAVLSVADHGVGILNDEEAAVFAPFSESGNGDLTSRAGLGLSLYLAREIVQRCQGRIWYESTPGRGTTFYVALPVSQADAQAI